MEERARVAAPAKTRVRPEPRASIVYERAPGDAFAPLRPWQRREPEKTVLWKLLTSELDDFLLKLQEATGRGLPGYIDRELRRYIDCGILERGFARVVCSDCKREILVAFSCKGRGLCPSCTARRMADVAAHLVDRVIPRVPVRQFVITFPRRVRWHLAHDPKLAAEALTLCLRVIFTWQRCIARHRGVDFGAPRRSQSARSAAVAFVQRFDSSLSLDWHIHALVCNGVFARSGSDPDARPRFHRLPAPTDEDVATLLSTVARRVLALLRRKGRLDDETEEPDDLQTQLELSASRPLGRGGGEIPAPPPLCARLEGFSLHAGRAIHENDREGLEQLARYCARPALSLARLSITDDGLVRYRMKRVFSDGRSEVLLPPHDFIARICALIPQPRIHLVRYFGAFAPTARGRAALVGKRNKSTPESAATVDKRADPPPAASAGEDATSLGAPPPDPDRSPRLDWAALLQRIYKIDALVCSACGGRLRVIALLTDERVVRRILDHVGIPRVVLAARARPPPPQGALAFASAGDGDDPCVDPLPAD